MNLIKLQTLNIKLISIIVFTSVLTFTSKAQNFSEYYPMGARQGGVGGAGVAMVDIWSASHNQAALAFLQNPSIGVFYENRFTSFGYQGFAGAYPLNNSALSFNVSYLGVRAYSFVTTDLAYAIKLNDKISASAGINFHHSQFSESTYNNSNAVTAEIGIFSQISDNFAIGAHIFNPMPLYVSKQDSGKYTSILSVGMLYKPAEMINMTFQLDKDTRYPLTYRGGIEYLYKDKLMFRIGLSSSKYSIDEGSFRYYAYSFGIGYLYKSFSLNLSFYRHYTLGFTPQFSVDYKF